MQRIILSLWLLFASFLSAESFQHFVTLCIIDTQTGNHENILLESGKVTHDDKRLFEITVKSIEADEGNPDLAWVNLEIRYLGSKADVPICVQRGKLCTNQLYRFQDNRYIFAFDVPVHLKEE